MQRTRHLHQCWKSSTVIRHSININPNTSPVSAYTKKNTPNYLEAGGVGTIHGTVLVSEELYKTPEGPSELVDMISKLKIEQGSMVEIATFGGGQVDSNKDIDSAVHPTWREALSVIDLFVNLPTSPSFEIQRQAQGFLNEVQIATSAVFGVRADGVVRERGGCRAEELPVAPLGG